MALDLSPIILLIGLPGRHARGVRLLIGLPLEGRSSRVGRLSATESGPASTDCCASRAYDLGMEALNSLLDEIQFHERFRGYDPEEVDSLRIRRR